MQYIQYEKVSHALGGINNNINYSVARIFACMLLTASKKVGVTVLTVGIWVFKEFMCT